MPYLGASLPRGIATMLYRIDPSVAVVFVVVLLGIIVIVGMSVGIVVVAMVAVHVLAVIVVVGKLSNVATDC